MTDVQATRPTGRIKYTLRDNKPYKGECMGCREKWKQEWVETLFAPKWEEWVALHLSCTDHWLEDSAGDVDNMHRRPK